MNLFSILEHYYRCPDKDTARLLWEAIIHYDFHDYQEFSMQCMLLKKPNCKLNFVSGHLLQTNGSTSGDSRQYFFYPNFDFWWRTVESKVKPIVGKVVVLNLGLLSKNTTHCFGASHYHNYAIPPNYIGTILFHLSDSVGYLIDRLSAINDKITIATHPTNMLFLLQQKEFIQFLTSGSVSSIITYDWDAFYKWSNVPKNVCINDNMVNWVNLSNFYTCQFRTKHFLPLFVGENSLLNFLDTNLDSGDRFIVGSEVKKCPCGKNYLDISFIPHISTVIRTSEGKIVHDLSIIELLDSSYINLQFVQNNNVVDVLFIGEMSIHDKDVLKDYFGNLGFGVRFLRHQYFLLGGKLPIFTNNKRQLPYSCFVNSLKIL